MRSKQNLVKARIERSSTICTADYSATDGAHASCKNLFLPNPPSLPTITHPPTTTTTTTCLSCLLPCYCAVSISFRLRLPNPQHQTPPHPPPLPRWLPPSAVPASSRPGRPLAQHRLRRTVSTVLSVSLNRPYVPLPSCLEYVKRRPERNSRHAR